MKKFFNIVFGVMFAFILGVTSYTTLTTNDIAFADSNTLINNVHDSLSSSDSVDQWSVIIFAGEGSFTSSNVLTVYDRRYLIFDSATKYILTNVNTWSAVSFFPGGIESQVSYKQYWWYGLDGKPYFSYGSTQYFIRDSYSWGLSSWVGLTNFNGDKIVTTNNAVYYFNGSSRYVLGSDGSTWSPITLQLPNGITTVNADSFVTLGDYTYYLYQSSITADYNVYLFNESNLSFNYLNTVPFSLVGAGNDIWSDGYNYYWDYQKINFSNEVFNLQNVNVNNIPSDFQGTFVWSNGKYLYYSDGGINYICMNAFYYAGYNAGYELGYDAGYQLGYRDGSTGTGSSYDNGYQYGYELGYDAGNNAGYNEGLTVGYNNGVRVGYSNGYNDGVEAGSDYSFFSLIGAVVDAPIKAFTGLFNFEIFGTNISSLLLALFTGSIIIVIVKFALGGK